MGLPEKVKVIDANIILRLLTLRGMRLSNKSTARRALNWYVEKNVDWTDAFVAAEMRAKGSRQIYSYDRRFERFSEITRIEP
jgi:predicted nucleic acid-binding protein